MKDTRIERDFLGRVSVPARQLWGAQTQRALQNFDISTEKMPAELIAALAHIKRAAAFVNQELGLLPPGKAAAIVAAADEIINGVHAGEFPLAVWQSGSGTQTHMNVNEVLANRASELLGGQRGSARLVHPNDEVNRGQSSNDVVPSAMHVATALAFKQRLLPTLTALRDAIAHKADAFASVVKTGRTHLQDAVPLTVGQEFSGYVAQLDFAQGVLRQAQQALLPLAIGGTAVGTGLGTHPQFGTAVAARLADELGLPFCVAPNRFAAQAGHDPMLVAHGGLRSLATVLTKIANDIRLAASGPTAGLGEFKLPDNEPGSSIMPGKINPTQCEAMTMICAQVFGNDVAVNIGAAGGHFEMNAYKPLIVHNVLQSVRLLTDAMVSFNHHCIAGLKPQAEHLREVVERSAMLATALLPHLGYDKTAEITRKAVQDGSTLKEAAIALGYVDEEQFDAWVDPIAMTSGS